VNNDTTVQVWDVTTGRFLYTLHGCPKGVASLAFSPDGKVLAIAGWGTEVTTWDVSTRQPLLGLKIYSSDSWALAYSPDGLILAGGGRDNLVRLWDSRDGILLDTLGVEDRSHTVGSIAYSPDGTVLAISYWDLVTLWDVRTMRRLHTLKEQAGPIFSIAFSPNGFVLATTADDHTIKYWNTQTCALIAMSIPFGENSWVILDTAHHFDGTPDAADFLHFTVGNEIVELDQLKRYFYVPDLLSKLLSDSASSLDSVRSPGYIRLYPDVQSVLENPNSHILSVGMVVREGGLGSVVLYVNGKQVVADVRDLDRVTFRVNGQIVQRENLGSIGMGSNVNIDIDLNRRVWSVGDNIVYAVEAYGTDVTRVHSSCRVAENAY
jgi:hypothetical protein